MRRRWRRTYTGRRRTTREAELLIPLARRSLPAYIVGGWSLPAYIAGGAAPPRGARSGSCCPPRNRRGVCIAHMSAPWHTFYIIAQVLSASASHCRPCASLRPSHFSPFGRARRLQRSAAFSSRNTSVVRGSSQKLLVVWGSRRRPDWISPPARTSAMQMLWRGR